MHSACAYVPSLEYFVFLRANSTSSLSLLVEHMLMKTSSALPVLIYSLKADFYHFLVSWLLFSVANLKRNSY